MPLITFVEIINLIILTIVIGYIFSSFVRRPRTLHDLYRKGRFNLEDIKFSSLIAAPAVVLHELAHKFVAIGFGLAASFNLFPFGLFLGIFLRFINSPFLIVAPGYVLISQGATQLQNVLISFAGPFINLFLWLGSLFVLRTRKLKRSTAIALHFSVIINMWLFIFNMLPIPPLDGSKVWFGLFKLLF